MLINTAIEWSTDESFTSTQIVERDGRKYLRQAIHDAEGQVVNETLTPAEDVRAAHNTEPNRPGDR